MIRIAYPLPSSPTARVVTERLNAERICEPCDVPTKRKKMSRKTRMWIWQKDRGRCYYCGEFIDWREPFEITHPKPLALGGKDTDSNRFVAHPQEHAAATYGADLPAIAKAKRGAAFQETGRSRKLRGAPMAGTRASGIQRRMSGEVRRR